MFWHVEIEDLAREGRMILGEFVQKSSGEFDGR